MYRGSLYRGSTHPRKSRASTEGGGAGRKMGARKVRKRRGEGEREEKGEGKPWESSVHRAFLDRRANTISEV